MLARGYSGSAGTCGEEVSRQCQTLRSDTVTPTLVRSTALSPLPPCRRPTLEAHPAVMYGRPPVGKGYFDGVMTGVLGAVMYTACCCGLCMAAGPDESSRGPSSNHPDVVEATMTQRSFSGPVTSTVRHHAISAPCLLYRASTSTCPRLSGRLEHRGRRTVFLVLGEHRPGDARRLVGERHRRQLALGMGCHPEQPRRRALHQAAPYARQIGRGAQHQDAAQIGVALLGDRPAPDRLAGAV